MVKKLLTVVILVLAINFLLVAGGIGALVGTGKLNRATYTRIRAVLDGADVAATAPTTAPSEATTQAAATRPTDSLADMLARQAGRPTTEQLDLIQTTMDSQSAVLDRRMRELEDLKRQVDAATAAVARDRQQLAQQRKEFETQTQEAARLQSDQGFQDAMQLYLTMPPKQVKQIFGGLDDPTVQRFLQAMPPRNAAKIVKEFKLPEEASRIGGIMERIRQGKPTTEPSNTSLDSPSSGKARAG